MAAYTSRRWCRLQQNSLRKVFLRSETKTNGKRSTREKGDTFYKFNVSVWRQEINEIISQGTTATACPLDTCQSASPASGVQMSLPLITPGNLTAQGHLLTKYQRNEKLFPRTHWAALIMGQVLTGQLLDW